MSETGGPQNPYGQDPNQNPYGAPPQQPNPYGTPPQPNPYGTAPQQPNPYGAPPSPYAAYGAGQVRPYASWGKRVGASLLDGLIAAVLVIPAIVGLFAGGTRDYTTTDSNGYTTTSTGPAPIGWVIFGVLLLLPIAFQIWNYVFKQGRTGYTIGKGVLGIKLIKDATGEVAGAGTAFLRLLISWVFSGVCTLVYLLDVLWPLWDEKRQTLHDKVVSTVVIEQPKP